MLQFFQGIIKDAGDHIWFERSEIRDRLYVKHKLKSHTDMENSLPILMFPEGICVNNSSIFQFNKGSFEAESDIYPAAIKVSLYTCHVELLEF